MKNLKSKRKYFFSTAAGTICLAVLLGFICLAALRYGSADMNTKEFFSALFKLSGHETDSVILFSVRLPRIAAGILAGTGLSVSGVLLQSVTGNALASPNIIGVNAGAGFFVALFLTLFPALYYALPLAAFAGALLATIIIIAVSGSMGAAKSTVILAGIALTTLLNAGISFLNLLDTDVLSSYNSFSVGGLAGVEPEGLILPAIIIAIGLGPSLVFSQRIDLLCLGDNAAGLGINTKALRFICILCASACAAAAVSFAGLLGFVGLVVPHISRRLAGSKTKSQLISSCFIGSATVVLADLFGRIIAAPSEIPVGIMMAFVGAPFFLILLFKRRYEIV